MDAFPYTTLTTALVILMTFGLAALAGIARGELKPPAMTGSEKYEIANRIHMNSLETLVLLLPLVWLTAVRFGDMWGALACVVWIVGRVMYRQAMLNDPSKRGPGMLTTLSPVIVMGVALIIVSIKTIVSG